MSDDEMEDTMTEPPPSVEIPLEDRFSNKSHHSSRKSSTSTSSFEDLNTLRLANTKRRYSGQSYHSDRSVPEEQATTDAGDIKSYHSDRSYQQEPAKVGVGEINTRTGSVSSDTIPLSPKGMLSFKNSSVECPTSPVLSSPASVSPNVFSAPTSIHSASSKANSKSTRGKSKRKWKASKDRDPENVNSIVKIDFEEIFAEPEGTYSFGTIWGATYKIFTDSKLWCYKFLSALCGVPCALCWGLHFACVSFCMIWYYQPGVRSFYIQMKPLQKIYGVLVNAFVEPCFTAVGKLFSSIEVNISNDRV